MSSPSIDQDKELAEFFTDVEHLRDAFKNAVAAPTLTKRLFVIHGVGGVGKSSLLRMFRLHCKSVNVPVALASGDEAKSAFDVLARWTEDLKVDRVAFPAFGKTYEHYREIQAKVDAQAKKAGGSCGGHRQQSRVENGGGGRRRARGCSDRLGHSRHRYGDWRLRLAAWWAAWAQRR